MSAATTTLPPRRRSTSARREPITAGRTAKARAPAACKSPLYSYAHNGRDASITGGFVYHGTQFPSSYQGSYFFADYAQNWIKRLTLDASGNVSGVFNFEPLDGSSDGPYGDIVYLTEGPDGALYYIDLGYSDTSGTFGVSKIRRIRFVSGNQAPIAVGSATPSSGPAPLAVGFSSAGSSDPEGQALTYAWTFGDGGTSTAANPSHTYAQAGQYYGAALGLGRCEHDLLDADLDQRRQPADGHHSRTHRRCLVPRRRRHLVQRRRHRPG